MAVDDGRLEGIQPWVDLARRLPRPYAAARLFLAGWCAYRQGNGALAGIAADLAAAAGPGSRAAALLRQTQASGINSRELPNLWDLPPADVGSD